jgi:hypothetical protein
VFPSSADITVVEVGNIRLRLGRGGVRGLGLLSKYWEPVPPHPVLLPRGEKGRSSSLGD